MNDQPFRIGLFGFIAILGAGLIFLWLLTFRDITTIFALNTATFFLIGGLSCAFILVGVKLEPFSLYGFIGTILTAGLNFFAIRYVHSLVPLQFEFLPMNEQMFAVFMGVAEECFFRLFLCGIFWKITRNFWLAVGPSSAIWTAYHMARYGGSGILIFLQIFICGCILGATYILTKSADGSIFGHAVVNYIALA